MLKGFQGYTGRSLIGVQYLSLSTDDKFLWLCLFGRYNRIYEDEQINYNVL